jgi:hypothetical protein
MNVIIIFNGLGNQMSQYAFYLQHKKKDTSTYFIPFCSDHNGLELESVFGVDCKESFTQRILYFLFRILLTDKVKLVSIPVQKLLHLFNCSIVKENFNYNFNSDYIKPSRGITFYYGGWHTEKYFVGAKDKVEGVFEFSAPTDETNRSFISSIKSTNSVSLHVRRGDFLNTDNINLFGGVCTIAYFEKAISTMESKVNNAHFFVFSNDLAWVKQNIFIKNVTYVDCNAGKNSWKDMYLMSLCQHNIIANSTFSWWGAWLNKNKNKIVISPKRFLNSDITTDVYPDAWTTVGEY